MDEIDKELAVMLHEQFGVPLSETVKDAQNRLNRECSESPTSYAKRLLEWRIWRSRA